MLPFVKWHRRHLNGALVTGLVGAGVALAALGWPADASAADAAAIYVEGIAALEAGEFGRAESELGRAVAADPDNADYLRARGVARLLAEQFPGALADLQRALRLNQDDPDAKLWLAAAFCMSGDPAAGSQHFTFANLPKDYAELVYNRMALEYWQSRDAATRSKRSFPDAARRYAQRHMATDPAANALVRARVSAALDRGDWPAALKDLNVLRRTAPDDVRLRGEFARCLLGLGDAWHAREEFTRVLSLDPLWGAGYAGRAQAASILGDVRRADSDRQTAAALDAAVERGNPRTADDEAVAQFAAALPGDVPDDALAEKALAVHRWFNAHRIRYDESYQDRIWALSDAARHDARNSAWPEGLARFLFRHHNVPAVWDGPRAVEPLRPQSPQDRAQELQRALDTAGAALRLDRRNVNALATRAEVFKALGNVGEAERLADQGLDIDRRNLRLLRLKQEILLDRAAALQAQASALRAGRDESHMETRSDGVYRVTTHYPPSAADLAQAAACEAQAAECRRAGMQLAKEIANVETVILPKLLKAGAFDEAARCDPDRVDVLKGQAELANRRGDTRGGKAYALLAAPLDHTTAAPELQGAWNEIVRTAWRAAGERLDASASIDPADARVPAYRAIIAAAHGDVPTAVQQRRAALALEEAKARLMGTSFVAVRAAPIRLRDAALTLAVRGQLADSRLAAGHAAAALAAFNLNAQIEPRFDRFSLVEFAPTALLPDPAGDPNTIPESPSLASLLAGSHLGAGRALLALGRPEEALQRYRTVLAYAANWPATAPGREMLKTPCGYAQLGLVEAALAAKDYDTARAMVMDSNAVAWGLPRELEQRRKALQQQIIDAQQRQEEQALEADARMTPRQMQARRLRDEIAAFQKQRDDTARELERPDQPEAAKQALRSSLAELDRMIAVYKARLDQLVAAPETTAPAPPVRGRRF